MPSNPLIEWALLRFRKEKRTLLGLIVFLVLFYGMIGLTVLLWLAGSAWRRDFEDLFTAFYYEAWAVNGLLLLLFLPARLAQNLAQENHRGTIAMLRLTGLGGTTLAVGKFFEAALLPVFLCILTLPIVLLGIGAQGGLGGTLRGYVGLLPLGLVYSLFAALIGMSVKKPQHAQSTAVFLILLLLGFTAGFNFSRADELRPLALLGPWGSGFSTVDSDLAFELMIYGIDHMPGELLQLPLSLLLAGSLFHGLSRRMGGQPVTLLGRWGALGVAAGVCFVAAVTFFPSVDTGVWWQRSISTRAAFTWSLSFAFFALLLLAAELPVRWQDLVRGLARRGPRNTPFPEERLIPLRFLPGLALPLLMGVLFVWPISYGYSSLWQGRTPEVSVEAVVVGLMVVALAWVFAGLAFQVVQLFLRDESSPRLIGSIGLIALWLVPFLVSFGLSEFGFPAELYELPRAFSPLYGIYAAGYATSTTATASGMSPLALATACAVLHVGGIGGMLYLLSGLRERAEEHANTLVALPADAYGAPGTLTQRCPQGHLYAETWKQCPHCPEADHERDDLPQPALQQEPSDPPAARGAGADAGGDRVPEDATVPRAAGPDLPEPEAGADRADPDEGGAVSGAGAEP